MVAERRIQFIDLAQQQTHLSGAVQAAIARVLAHGTYIMGPEVAVLERNLATFCGARHAVTCGNGTDALMLALMALQLEAGDAVIVPSFTFCATAEAVSVLGGIPIFADVDPNTFNVDVESMKAGILLARDLGLRLRGVITVDLFGLPCDYEAIEPIIRENDLFLVCDAAQAFGASYRGRRVGTFGTVTTTSFFPAKPLGCYGDGGALFTDDPSLAEVLRSLRIHGQGKSKYDNQRIGLNSRLDTLQAAILLEKLRIFPEEITRRQVAAEAYSSRLRGLVEVPMVPPGARSVWAQYTIKLAGRDSLARSLSDAQIPSAIYYGVPLHRQAAYAHYPVANGSLPVSDRLSSKVLSLPMHPWLSEGEIDDICDIISRQLRPAVCRMGALS